MIGRRYRYHYDEGAAFRGIDPDEILLSLGDQMMARSPNAVVSDVLRSGLQMEDSPSIPGIDQLREALRHEMSEQASEAYDVLTGLEHPDESALSNGASRLLRTLSTAPERAPLVISQIEPGDLDSLIDALEGTAAAQPLQRLGELGRLDRQLRGATSIRDVQAISTDEIAGALGAELGDALRALVTSVQGFWESGYVRTAGDRLSPTALRKLGDLLLRQAIATNNARAGAHQSQRSTGHERGDTSRPYQFGDPFDLDIRETLLAASRREARTPLSLRASDLTVFERDPTRRVATVLAIDRSRSMGERGYLVPARQVALAFASLVRNRYRQDRLHILGFSSEAREIQPSELDRLDWDRHSLGTNMQDAFEAGRRILAACTGFERRLILITDGEPTAWRDRSGTPRYIEPVSDEALIATYAAGRRCQRARVQVIVALLTTNETKVKFAQRLASEAGGELVTIEADEIGGALISRFGSA